MHAEGGGCKKNRRTYTARSDRYPECQPKTGILYAMRPLARNDFPELFWTRADEQEFLIWLAVASSCQGCQAGALRLTLSAGCALRRESWENELLQGRGEGYFSEPDHRGSYHGTASAAIGRWIIKI